MAFLPLFLARRLPSEPSFLQTCSCSRFYTVVLKSAFWQLAARLKDVEKTLCSSRKPSAIELVSVHIPSRYAHIWQLLQVLVEAT